MSESLVYIPAVPLPLQGPWTDHCFCRRRFRGPGRRQRYELHFRLEHQPGPPGMAMPQVAVTASTAAAIDRAVRARDWRQLP